MDLAHSRGERIRTSDPLSPRQVRCQAALRLGAFLGSSPSHLRFLFLLPSSVLEDGVGLLSLLALRFVLGEKLIDLLDVGALAGPLNDPDKVTSVLSM